MIDIEFKVLLIFGITVGHHIRDSVAVVLIGGRRPGDCPCVLIYKHAIREVKQCVPHKRHTIHQNLRRLAFVAFEKVPENVLDLHRSAGDSFYNNDKLVILVEDILNVALQIDARYSFFLFSRFFTTHLFFIHVNEN